MPKGLRDWAVWLVAWLVAQGIITSLWRLVVGLAENAVLGWGDDQIAAWLGITSPTLSAVIAWAIPFILAAITLLLFHYFTTRPLKEALARQEGGDRFSATGSVSGPSRQPEPQFRLDMRRFVLSNLKELQKSFSKLTESLITSSDTIADPTAIFFFKMTLSLGMDTHFQALERLFTAPPEKINEQTIQVPFDRALSGYRDAQNWAKQFKNTYNLPLDDAKLGAWLNSDARALSVLRDMLSSPANKIFQRGHETAFASVNESFRGSKPK